MKEKYTIVPLPRQVIILLDEYDTPMQKTHRTVRQTQHQSPTKPPGLCLFFCFAQFRISFESFLLAPQAPCYRQLKKWRSPFSLEAPVRFFPQFLLNLRKSGFFSFFPSCFSHIKLQFHFRTVQPPYTFAFIITIFSSGYKPNHNTNRHISSFFTREKYAIS